jgi:hypothetical protein
VLVATVRGSGQSSHARLIYGLTSTKEEVGVGARRAHPHKPQHTGRALQHRFHLAAGGEPAMATYLQKPNRPLLAPADELRKRIFRPVAGPGAVLRNGRLAALWRVRAKGKKIELSVEKLQRIARSDLEDEAQRLAALRGATEAVLVVD